MKEGPPIKRDEQKDALHGIFFDLYGMPMSWAIQVAGWDNPIGKHWRKKIDNFKKLLQDAVEEGKTDVI